MGDKRSGLHQTPLPKRKRAIATLLAFFFMAMGGGIYLLMAQEQRLENLPCGDTATMTTTFELQENPSIAIPGYEGLTLQADTVKQNICLNNPSENTCIFYITLRLEDGSVLWTSQAVLPGEQSAKMVLNQPLAKENYPAVLQYDCFTRDGKRLNGVETKLTLRVK